MHPETYSQIPDHKWKPVCSVCGATPYSYASSPSQGVYVGDLFCHKHTLPENVRLSG